MKNFVKEAATGYNIVKLPALGSAGSMIIEGTIKPLTKEDNEPEYDFKFTSEKKYITFLYCRKKVKPTIDNYRLSNQNSSFENYRIQV